MNKIFAIGDIHGCVDKLKALMEKIPVDCVNDTLIFIGDYIDRGPGSFDVVDYLVELKKRHPDIVFLKGNHEDMLQKYLEGTDRFTYLFNGGQRTLDSYLNRQNKSEFSPIPSNHLDFYKSLVLHYQTEDYLFVHAGLRENVPLDKQNPEELLWIREDFIYSKFDFGKRVVFGHTPFAEPLLLPNKIGIDTGAVYGNQLTCVQLPELIFFSA
ncbi:MAG: serine/threonine protein phosphatase [Desulfobacterales bacterium]|nr:MAG: serine/threonine protein phosphatase [Desulfobacterales bacterium]